MGKKNTVPVNPPLPLEGAWNIRELGGYPTRDGRMTRKGVFLRADGTHNLSARDVESLRERGVTLAVDLRSPEEVRRQPSRLAGQEGIRYENVSMFDRMHSALFQDDFPKSMAALYAQLLHNAGVEYARVFRLFLENDGVSLFHCTAGKDRTGVVAMLLLQLAGVPEETIAEDYAASEENLRKQEIRQRAFYAQQGLAIPAHVFGSKPEDMEQTLSLLYREYGGAAGYLRACGLTQEELSRLISRFVQ